MRQGRRKRHLASKADSDYPGDYQGVPRLEYAPRDDGAADPGEVVWTWVPYEEDHSKGKDRPVLVIGEEDGWLLVLQLTSKDHDRDEQQEARAGRYWIDIGTGEWDRRRRPSEARVNRIIRCRPDDVRRIGGRLSEKRFREVAREVQQHYQ
ncbi:MAG: growth inhibitor PemK [Propionibacterium sp.]|nr:MAG: growth inhibitor PemK [Propionibacterium sp.]